MFPMKYHVPEIQGLLPMYVELEMDGDFHVNAVYLVIGHKRVKCE
jgi:hypothetical protein